MPAGYHPGELAVQEQAGQRETGARMVRAIRSTVPTALTRFLSGLPWIMLGGNDSAGNLWTGVLIGAPGIVAVLDDTTLSLPVPDDDDPLHDLGGSGPAEAGVLAIDLNRRMRARINGTVRRDHDRLALQVVQCYANCPKYIQRRELTEQTTRALSVRTTDERLTDDWVDLIRHADTAFLATIAPGHGADCSHRGGVPGFLQCDPSGRRIRFRDYPGNSMFNTLGNLMLDDRAGLTIPDFVTGSLLQLSGRARVTSVAPKDRMVELDVERVVHRTGLFPWHFGRVEYSPDAVAVADDTSVQD